MNYYNRILEQLVLNAIKTYFITPDIGFKK